VGIETGRRLVAWLNFKRQDRDSKENRAQHEDAVSKRLNRVFASGSGIDGVDPEVLEARLRNLSHGTNSK
jgi:hypothetical protein